MVARATRYAFRRGAKLWTSLATILFVANFSASADQVHAQVKFRGCGGQQERFKPTMVGLTCADGKLRVESLEWRRWDSAGAVADGLLTYPDCAPNVPLFRCRNYAHDPVVLRLVRAEYCPRFGSRVFTEAVVVNEGAPTPATKYSRFAFRCPKPKPRRPFLGSRFAARLMRKALTRDSRLSFEAAYRRRVTCNKRLSRARRRCKMSWIVGDLYFDGRGTIWLTSERGQLYWNFAYRMQRRNAYCEATGGTNCTDVIVRR